MSNPPIPLPKLTQLTHETCSFVFHNTTTYEHAKTETWNSTIITTLLTHLVALTTPSTATSSPFKFIITSTIIQHTVPSRPAPAQEATPAPDASVEGVKEEARDGDSVVSALSERAGGVGGGSAERGTAGRRGMHSASGAYWDKEKDGMWSFKFEGEGREFDVVVGVVWIAL